MKTKFLLFLPLLLLFAPAAFAACGCPGNRDLTLENQEKIFENSAVVFIGEVTAVAGKPKLEGYRKYSVDYVITARKLYKGKPAPDSTFTVRVSEGCCDNGFRLGEKWLIVADLEEDSALHASICSPSAIFRNDALQKPEAIAFQLFLDKTLQKRAGKFTFHYPGGTVSAAGTIKNGALQKLSLFEEAGNKKMERVYKKGVLVEEFDFYRYTGGIRQYNNLKAGPNNLKVIYYHTNGKKQEERVYSPSEYFTKTYFESGRIESETKEIRSEGYRTYKALYFPNGNIKEKGWYRKNNKSGKWFFGTETGDVWTEVFPE